MSTQALLKKLHIKEINPGVSTGSDNWISDPRAKEIISYNPSTGDRIASVIPATADTYQQVIATAQKSFLSWRQVPAPKRGLVIRDLADALRENKAM